MICIENPQLEICGASIRGIVDIRSNETKSQLWYQVPGELAPHVTIDRADAFVVGLLVECMAKREDLRVDVPLSASLMRGLSDYQYAIKAIYPSLHVVEITCDEIHHFDDKFQGRALGTGFSAGVDAFSTLYDHLVEHPPADELEYLVSGNAGTFPSNIEGQAAYRAYQQRLRTIAAEIGLPILFVDSNLAEHVSARRGGFCSRVISGVLLLQKLFHTYLHQTGTTYAEIFGDTDGSSPLCDHLLSTDVTHIVSDGAQYTRIEKIARIADWSIAQRNLHVCPIIAPNLKNCSRCTKCTATMLAIDMLGKSGSFRDAFDFTQLPASKEAYVARNLGRATIASNYLWRDLVRFAEEVEYPLLDHSRPRTELSPPATEAKAHESQTQSKPKQPITAFWQQNGNFGDQLSPELLTAFGYEPQRTSPDTARIVVGGSVLHLLPRDFSGCLLGAGFIHEYHNHTFPRAGILATRGRLSAERCRAPADCLFADAGLLAPRLLLELPEVRHTLAIIPHKADQTAPQLRAFAARYPDDIVLVNVQAEPIKVLSLLATAEYVLSSSLYGLIAADALGKPNRWLLLSRHVPGGEFKFRDYYSAFNEMPTPLIIDGSEGLADVLAQIGPPRTYTVERSDALAELIVDLA